MERKGDDLKISRLPGQGQAIRKRNYSSDTERGKKNLSQERGKGDYFIYSSGSKVKHQTNWVGGGRADPARGYGSQGMEKKLSSKRPPSTSQGGSTLSEGHLHWEKTSRGKTTIYRT